MRSSEELLEEPVTAQLLDKIHRLILVKNMELQNSIMGKWM
jgi:hypothetical protein